jgi:ribosomal protein S18 acetylase RimI-like enzyme
VVRIRRFVADDTEPVVALWRRVFPEYLAADKPQRDPRANIARKLTMQPELFWVAEEGGHVIGTIMAGYDGHRGWIYSLGVEPEQRRTGIARALLHEAEAALRDLGCPKVNLQVSGNNDVARALYEAAGYVTDEVVSYGKRLKQP